MNFSNYRKFILYPSSSILIDYCLLFLVTSKWFTWSLLLVGELFSICPFGKVCCFCSPQVSPSLFWFNVQSLRYVQRFQLLSRGLVPMMWVGLVLYHLISFIICQHLLEYVWRGNVRQIVDFSNRSRFQTASNNPS